LVIKFRLIALVILLLVAALAAKEDAAPASSVNGVTVNLNAGWNGVGFQATQLTELTANVNIAGLASFANGTYQIGNYALSDVNAGAGGRRGFWVFATGPTSFNYSGNGGPDFVDLVNGYNLVSFCTSSDIPGVNLTATVNGSPVALGSVVLPTFFEIGANNAYTPVDVTAGGTLKPGRAYWVFASSNVRLNTGSGPSPSPGASPSPGSSPGGVPTQLQFNGQPIGVKGNTAFQVTVRLLDSNGSLVTSATNSVTLSLAKDPTRSAMLGGTLTQAAAGGVATFTGLTLNQAGAGFQLRAAGTGLTNATSNAFNVTAQTISFAPATFFMQNNDSAGQQNSQGMAVADFDNDGHQDIACGNPMDDTAGLSIFYGKGDGTFEEKKFNLNIFGMGVAVGQFGPDPKFPDLVVGGNQVAVLLLNTGANRSFTQRDIAITNVLPSKLCTLDVNNDGKRDIGLGDDNSRKLTLLINSGDNMNFTTQVTADAFANSFSGVRSADMDNDGKQDIVLNVFNNATPAFVMWNTGNANSFFVNDATNRTDLPMPGTSRGFNLGDFNNDGRMDAVVVNNNGTPPFGRPFLNAGNRMFTAQPDQLITGGTGDTSGGGNTQCAVFGDLNVDGALEIIMGNQGPPKNATLPGIDWFTNVLTGTNAVFGNDQFAPSANNVGFRAVDVGDFNEDSRLDVVGMNSFNTGGIVMYLNTSK